MNAITPTRSALPVSPSANYTGAQMALIKRTVAKDTSPDEFDLFMAVASLKGLDPFSKQISAIVFSKDDEKKRQMAIITTIDGMRAIAARSGRYRPDEDEPDYTYDEALRGPGNPVGLVKARVRIWIADPTQDGGWKPATGVAYWDEFAPVKDEIEGGFDWVDTGETWPDTGKPKKRKVPRDPNATSVRKVDGNWSKMPRVMLAKCAEAQALRKAFPEDLSGLYEGSEMERAQVIDVTASEIIESHAVETTRERLGLAGTITFQFSPTSALEPVGLGKLADKIIEESRGWDLFQLRWFRSVNQPSLRDFWARAKADALAVARQLDEREKALLAAEPA
jgi:phage recombination protein Bet